MPRGYIRQPCSIDGCDKTRRGQGYCQSHYRRWQRYGDPLAGGPFQERTAKVCEYDGCFRPSYAKRLCSKHYARLRAHGDPSIVITPDKFRHPTRTPDQARDAFMRRLRRTGTGCLAWTGATDPSGYGRVEWNGAIQLAHRVAYQILVGPIPDGQFICHRCDNPPCCEPQHLFAGTGLDNHNDMWSKGRGCTPTVPPLVPKSTITLVEPVSSGAPGEAS